MPKIVNSQADFILTNAVIYTQDDARTKASTVAVRGNKVVYVGNDTVESLGELCGEATRVVDLQGRSVVPVG